MLNRLEAFAAFVGQQTKGRRQEVAEGFFVRAPDAATELVQVTQTELMRVVYDHGIGIANVNARFNDGGGDEDIEGAVNEPRHDVFELLAVHLAVADPDACVRDQPGNHAGDFLDVFDPVVDEIHLATAAEFVRDGVSDDFFVERRKGGLDRLAVGWRCGNGAQVARAHQAELQRTGDGRGREGQGVDVGPDGFELVLNGYSKLLLLINDKQTKVLELNTFSDERVCSDQNIDLSVLQFLEGFGELFARLESVDVVHSDGKITQPPSEASVVLHG